MRIGSRCEESDRNCSRIRSRSRLSETKPNEIDAQIQLTNEFRACLRLRFVPSLALSSRSIAAALHLSQIENGGIRNRSPTVEYDRDIPKPGTLENEDGLRSLNAQIRHNGRVLRFFLL